MTLEDLTVEERLRLLCFVCSFAWSDLEIADSEKAQVRKLVEDLEMPEAEREQVERWLKVPPRPEEIDPTDIPREHRQIFLAEAMKMVSADGKVEPNEMENLALFEQLLR